MASVEHPKAAFVTPQAMVAGGGGGVQPFEGAGVHPTEGGVPQLLLV